MKIPPFFIGIIILFWGYETKNMIIAFLIFTILESSNFIKKRWDFEIDDFIKISDLNSLILLSVVTFVVLNNETEQALLIIQKWFPAIFLPIMIAQVYHIGDKIIIATKLGQTKKNLYNHNPMNFSFIYIAIAILSAATANNRGFHFQIVLIILFLWFFFYNKKKLSHVLVFLLAMVFVSGISFILNNAFESSYTFINKKISNFWKNQYSNGRIDPYRSLTSLGHIGDIKSSGKIIMRISSDAPPPVLLKTASYNFYFSTNWFSKENDFDRIKQNKNKWNIYNSSHKKTKTLIIERYLSDLQTLLPIPYGCTDIEGSDIEKLQRDSNNIIRVEANSDILIYKVRYRKSLLLPQGKPKKADLDLPQEEYATLKSIIKNLKMHNLPARGKLLKIKKFFNNGFVYSLKQRENKNDKSLISNFLLSSKTGHCEYFATATALLLRAADIPAKYINGFVIDEKSAFSNRYIIRERHAHAWVEAYIDNKWEVVDTTPSIWLEDDKKNASIFENIRDFFSFFKDKLILYFKNNKQQKNIILLTILIILILFLISKIILRLKKKERAIEKNKIIFTQRSDSEFDLIIKYLKKLDIVRKINEPFFFWIRRINIDFPIDINTLTLIYKIHLRNRFDPEGLTEKERTGYKKQIEIWLTNN